MSPRRDGGIGTHRLTSSVSTVKQNARGHQGLELLRFLWLYIFRIVLLRFNALTHFAT